MLLSFSSRFSHNVVDSFSGIIWQVCCRIPTLKLQRFSNLVEPCCGSLIHHVVRVFETDKSPVTLQQAVSLPEDVFRVGKVMEYSAEHNNVIGPCRAGPFVGSPQLHTAAFQSQNHWSS